MKTKHLSPRALRRAIDREANALKHGLLRYQRVHNEAVLRGEKPDMTRLLRLNVRIERRRNELTAELTTRPGEPESLPAQKPWQSKPGDVVALLAGKRTTKVRRAIRNAARELRRALRGKSAQRIARSHERLERLLIKYPPGVHFALLSAERGAA